MAKVAKTELSNVVVIRADARPIVNLFLPDRSVAAYHVYFPDPWPKKRHLKHRLFSKHLICGFQRTLVDGGVVSVASDVPDYAATILAMLTDAGFQRLPQMPDGATQSNFGRKFDKAGKKILAGIFAVTTNRSGLP